MCNILCSTGALIGYKGTFTVEATAFDSNGVIDIDMLNKQFEFIRNAMRN